MPEQVLETEEQTTETVEQADDSSQSETTETQTEETQTEETGEEKSTGEEKKEQPEAEPTATDPKAERREQYWKRQAEKRERELAEERAKAETSPARQQEIQRQQQESQQQYLQELADNLTGGNVEQAAYLDRIISQRAQQIAASQVRPLTGTFHRTQYDGIKKELATDPEIVDFKTLEPAVDKLIHDYEVRGQSFYMSNKKAVKDLFIWAQGQKMKDLLKAAEERGRQAALKDKRIESERGIPRTGVAGGNNTGGITQADIELSNKRDTTPEFEYELRIEREKNERERKKKK